MSNSNIAFNLGRNPNLEVREAIIRTLARKGAVTFRTAPKIRKFLASRFPDINLVTVNNHLRSLTLGGLAQATGEKVNGPGRGRPSNVFAVTEKGMSVVEDFRKNRRR